MLLPRLASGEVRRRNPAEPRPNAPDVAARRRAARQRWLWRQPRARAVARTRASQIVSLHWPAICAVAVALLDHGELSQHQIGELIEQSDEARPAASWANYALSEIPVVDSPRRLLQPRA